MICKEAFNLIKVNEGCVLHAYPDPASGGDPWTIGYGHTAGVHPGQKITQAEAEAFLMEDLEKFENGVDDLLEEDATENQFGAMVSLAFNIGLGNFKISSVLRKHNLVDFDGAANAFLSWNKAGRPLRVFPGLDRRRHEERALYLKSDA